MRLHHAFVSGSDLKLSEQSEHMTSFCRVQTRYRPISSGSVDEAPCWRSLPQTRAGRCPVRSDSAVSGAKYNHCRSFRLETDFGTGIHFVDGSGRIGSDMPPRLFAIIWNIRFKAESSYGFGIDANFQTGLITNFEDSVREGWRFPGRVVTYGDI